MWRDPIVILCVAAVALILAGRWIHHMLQQESRKMAEDFVKEFPGKCLICSYHHFGVSAGLRPPGPIKPHDCIEKP